MRTAVAMALDGVLRKPLDEHAHDRGGWFLYRALSEQFRLVVLGTEDPKKDEHFLLTNGMSGHVRVEPLGGPEDGFTEAERMEQQLVRLRRDGYVFEFVVVSDPEFAKVLIEIGQTVLLYTHPLFTDPSFRPDRGGIRAWSELEAEIDFQRTARAEKLRDA